MIRLLFLLFLSSFFSCRTATKNKSENRKSRPNIVFILTDDQGYGDLAAHGNPWLKTPNMDALYNQSVRLTNFHSATTCAPTRAGIMAGVDCNRAGAWHTVGGRSMLGARFATLADELKEEGYATGLFGKWHLGDNYPFRPQDRGFDEVVMHGGGGVGQTPDPWNNDYFDDNYLHNGELKNYKGYCTDVWFEESFRFIREQGEKEEPFFAYIATNAPHGPYHVEERYVTPYRNQPDIPNPEFFGMIANLDENVGKLMQLLETSGLSDNTLVVFMTDNGTSSGATLDQLKHVTKGYNAGMRGRKVDEYEGGHRVPLFLRFPHKDGIKATDHDQLTMYTDLMPTLVEYAGGKVDADYELDGTSLMPLLTSGEQDKLTERYRVVDTQREDIPVKGKRSCVMQGRWRLMNGKELYDLSVDPGQRTDLAARHPERVEAMKAAYEDWWNGMAEDLKVTHEIIVGHKAEPVSVLTAHDWHTTKSPPWNQNHIREGRVDNGWWAIDVARPGNYRLRLYRYPPEAKLPLDAEAPEGDDIPNGTAYLPGVNIAPVSARCSVGGEEIEAEPLREEHYLEFEVKLSAGPTQLQTWVTDKAGVERGAYYVTVERVG